MDANVWAIGLEQALESVRLGVERANGSMIQVGIDRLGARARMSEELSEALPNLFAEAAQDGMARAWSSAWDKGVEDSQMPAFGVACEDACWLLCIIAKQDDWGKLCVEEAIALMARGSARCVDAVKALTNPSALDCLLAASSFFAALSCYDKLEKTLETSEHVGASVGAMLAAWGVENQSLGAWLWDSVPEFKGLSDGVSPETLSQAVEACQKSIKAEG